MGTLIPGKVYRYSCSTLKMIDNLRQLLLAHPSPLMHLSPPIPPETLSCCTFLLQSLPRHFRVAIKFTSGSPHFTFSTVRHGSRYGWPLPLPSLACVSQGVRTVVKVCHVICLSFEFSHATHNAIPSLYLESPRLPSLICLLLRNPPPTYTFLLFIPGRLSRSHP